MTQSLESLFQQTHSLQWPICLNDPFTWKPLSADPFSWMIEWPIQLNDPMHSDDPFPIHSNDPFAWMTHSLKWPIQFNDPFTLKPLSADPFTWMMHSLEWPICVQRWNVCLPLLSKQYYLNYKASDVITRSLQQSIRNK